VAVIMRAVILLGPDERLITPTSLVGDAPGRPASCGLDRPSRGSLLAADFRNGEGPDAQRVRIDRLDAAMGA
jgi:hypothetical protein